MFIRLFRHLLILSVLFTFQPGLASAAEAVFSWLPNTESTLAGYKIHYGTSVDNYSQVLDVGLPAIVNDRVTATVTGLVAGTTYYFAATAYDSNGEESGYSNQATFTTETEENSTGAEEPPPETEEPLPETEEETTTETEESCTDTGDCSTETDESNTNTEESNTETEENTTETEETSPPPAHTNSPPTALGTSFTVAEYETYAGMLTGTDPDNDPLTFALASQAHHGHVVVALDGSFTYTAGTDFNSSDSFTFTVSDGMAISEPALVEVTITPAKNNLVLEAGEISVNHVPVRVSFAQEFTEPVVVANMITLNDDDPCVIRISDVNASGFTIALQEYEYLDGHHKLETVSYLVMEKGTYTLNDGTMVEAGTFDTEATIDFGQQLFTQPMNRAPVVLSSIVTINGANAVTGRIEEITNRDFRYLLQEQQRNPRNHPRETVAYIAWEPGSGSHNGLRYEAGVDEYSVHHRPTNLSFSQAFADQPFVLADMQTTVQLDTAILRIVETSPQGLRAFVQQEQSYDRRTNHKKESVGYLALIVE